MSKRNVVVVVVVVALVAGVWVLRGGSSDSGGDGDSVAETKASPKVPAAKRTVERSEQQASAGNKTTQITMDMDPVGTLMLEGQVVDAAGDPVADAVVYLGSRPARTATTGEDGSFSFDKLVGRRYAISARADDRVGGPKVFNLTADSDPVVLRLHAAASIAVTVVDRDSGEAISGANVGMMGMQEAAAVTDGDGRAIIRGVRSGGEQLRVQASGYATAKIPLRVPDAAIAMERRVELERGVEIAGVVLSAAGKPVKDARVVARNAARPFEPINIFADGVATDARGRFQLEGLAVGSYRFLALHEGYAPGSSDHVSLSHGVQPKVEIVLQEGGVVAGIVRTGAGDPAPWAQVQLTSAPGARGLWGGGVQRGVVADEKGHFEVKGLPREKLTALARTDAASSDIVDVDLKANAKVDDVELRLTVTGSIAGRVVDDAGEPVAEVQVTAQPDFWAGQSSREALLRGGGFATTDGDGNFAIRGLSDGAFLVRASRGGQSTTQALGKPAKAKTGDEGVEVVLAGEGAVKGKVVAADGSAPEMAIASIAFAGAVPVVKGEFKIEGVPPGTYDVTLRGPFPRRVVKDVEIKTGETTDVGTVKIEIGRAITGRVTDSTGRAIEGATVALGQQLVGDGANLLTSLDDATMSAMGIRRAVATGGGEYVLAGVDSDEVAIAAEHPEHGRSQPVTIPKNGGDARIDLVLVPFGSVAGKVTVGGAPAPDVSVLVTSNTTSRQVIATRSGMDGGFLVERVPAGEYKVTAMTGGGATAQMVATQVDVVAGKRANVDLAITVGSIDFSVMVSGKDGAQVDAAQVFLFGNPELLPKTGGEVNQVFLSASESGDGKMAFANAGTAATFAKIEPGDYALCIIPITGDMNDPTFATRLQQHALEISVYCDPIDVPASPEKQRHDVAVPAMKPLPE